MKTVLILTNSINGLYSFRRELIERLINEKNAVIISSPQGTKSSYFKQIGCQFIETSINRRGKNLIADFKLLINYLKIIGNVGMILHCAPLLLNTGWTENKNNIYKYYYDGITPSISRLLEKIDQERVLVSKKLGLEVETTLEWLKRTYQIKGENLNECIQNNEAYKTIDAPSSLYHRYIFEDVPYGLVPLEAVGKMKGLSMKYTGLIIDLASSLLDIDFRTKGRNYEDVQKYIKHIT